MKAISIETITRIVCHHLRVPIDQVRAKTRIQEVVQARQIAMYFAKQFTRHSLKSIGRHFDRDHSTVIHSIQSIEGLARTYSNFASTIGAISERIIHQNNPSIKADMKHATFVSESATVTWYNITYHHPALHAYADNTILFIPRKNGTLRIETTTGQYICNATALSLATTKPELDKMQHRAELTYHPVLCITDEEGTPTTITCVIPVPDHASLTDAVRLAHAIYKHAHARIT